MIENRTLLLQTSVVEFPWQQECPLLLDYPLQQETFCAKENFFDICLPRS
jgi:hypothetical protein